MENGVLTSLTMIGIILYCACLAVAELICILIFFRRLLNISDKEVRENHSDSEIRFLYVILTILLFKVNYLVYLLYF